MQEAEAKEGLWGRGGDSEAASLQEEIEERQCCEKMLAEGILLREYI